MRKTIRVRSNGIVFLPREVVQGPAQSLCRVETDEQGQTVLYFKNDWATRRGIVVEVAIPLREFIREIERFFIHGET